jgi:hypothetical protein
MLKTKKKDVPHTASAVSRSPIVSARIKTLRRNPMFKVFSTTALFGLLAVSAIHAQTGEPIQANVPFAFTVQDTTLAAGNYQLTYSNSAHILWIRGLDQNAGAAFATARPSDASGPSDSQGKLVFRCYDKICYLAQVWHGRDSGSRGLYLRQPERQRTLAFTTRVVNITIPAK